MKREPHIVNSIPAVSKFFGKPDRTVRSWFEKGAPGKRGRYDLFLIVEWWVENIVAKQTRQPSEEEKLEADLKSLKLRQQIREADLKYAKEIGTVMPKDHVTTTLQRVAEKYRQAGEILRKQYGEDAQSIILEVLEDVEAEVRKSFD